MSIFGYYIHVYILEIYPKHKICSPKRIVFLLWRKGERLVSYIFSSAVFGENPRYCLGVLVEANFLSGVFSPLASVEGCEKSIWWLWKESCVSTGVRKPGNLHW